MNDIAGMVYIIIACLITFDLGQKVILWTHHLRNIPTWRLFTEGIVALGFIVLAWLKITGGKS